MRWILGVTAVALIVGVVATMTVPAQTITPDEATLKLFPPETTGIAVVDVAGLRGSPLFNELILQKLPDHFPGELNEFIQNTGFEVQRDVDKVTVGRIDQRQALVIVQARYDHFKVEQFVQDKADHINTETYAGRVIYREGPTDAGDNRGGVSFIDGIIIAGNVSAVKQAIDRMVPSAPPSIVQNSDLMNDIRTIESGNQIWAVGKLDLGPIVNNAPSGPADKFKEMAGSIKGGTYQMRIDQDVHIKATGTFGSADMAKATGDTLRGLLSIARLQVAQQQDLTHLLDGVSVDNAAEKMTVTINASGDLLKQLQQSKGLPGFIH
jgi:hypothetical protein